MKTCEAQVKPEKVIVVFPGSERRVVTYRCPICHMQIMYYKGTPIHTHDQIHDDEIVERR